MKHKRIEIHSHTSEQSTCSSISAELVEVIEWIDDSSDTIVWRFPRYENEIKNGAHLIVRQAWKNHRFTRSR